MLDTIPKGLFEDFDPAIVAAVQGRLSVDSEQAKHARAHRRHSRHEMRRAKAEKTLAEILPPRFDAGVSWHILSHGDIDALSYLRHALQATHFDFVLLSTWCIATEDMTELHNWLDTGRIDELTLCCGEIFPGSYTAEYEMALKLEAAFGTRLIVARNHSKVTLAANHAEAYYLSIESSANVNTNPRIEQTSIHAGRELFEFYRDFFHDRRSIDKRAAG